MSSKRTPLIAANWKMHKTLSEAQSLASEVRAGLAPASAAEVALAPPYTALAAVTAELAGSSIRLAAQDTFWKREGAFTGAISPWMLADVGCTYVIIGHSERRQHFWETNLTVNLKIKASLEAGLKVILCVGETLEEREAEKTMAVVGVQLREGLAELPALNGGNLVVAYEPVWAIGTGRTATPDQAQEVHRFIRDQLFQLLIPGNEIRLLYGGSVTPDNADSLLAQPDLDGALVGGASLKASSFLKIIASAKA
jgi:triosephosphate isomerase (TIM)